MDRHKYTSALTATNFTILSCQNHCGRLYGNHTPRDAPLATPVPLRHDRYDRRIYIVVDSLIIPQRPLLLLQKQRQVGPGFCCLLSVSTGPKLALHCSHMDQMNSTGLCGLCRSGKDGTYTWLGRNWNSTEISSPFLTL
jgi:hypothetical protein